MTDELWRAATGHPFLHAVRDDSLDDASFDRWLAQDAFFAADLLNFQALLLARSPRPAQRVLADGCVAIVDELAWFDEMAARRTVDLGGPRAPATDDYAGLLDRLDAEPVPAALTALWAIEQVYLDAWTVARASTRFADFAAHWTTPEFAAYVAALRELAAPDEHAELVSAVLRCEITFWDFALNSR